MPEHKPFPTDPAMVKLSVITVCWNVEKTLPHTLDSFFAQDHPNSELVIIDAASQDATLKIIARYPQDRITLLSEPDKGMYDGLNKGLSRFTGDAFGVLHADDTYHDSRALSRIAEGLTRAEIVHGDLHFVADHAGKRVVRNWQATDRPASGMRSGWMPAHTTLYARRAVAERVGGFDLAYETAADYDWMLRAIEVEGFSTARIDAVLVDMMQGGRSTASLRSYVHHNMEALRARRRWLGAGLVDRALIAKPLRKVGQFLPGAKAG